MGPAYGGPIVHFFLLETDLSLFPLNLDPEFKGQPMVSLRWTTGLARYRNNLLDAIL
jgi:hypothetical protein